jgi:hypothetical protein
MRRIQAALVHFRKTQVYADLQVTELSDVQTVDAGAFYDSIIGHAKIPLSGKYITTRTTDERDGSLILVAKFDRTYTLYIRPQRNNEITLVVPK